MREIIVIAHNIRSAHNVGSIMRTCEGLGVKKLILSGISPYPVSENDTRLPHASARAEREISKTALGAEKYLSWKHTEDLSALIAKLKSEGYPVVSLEQSDKSISLDKFRPPGKIALVLGNEVEGINNEILDMSDAIVEIKMKGKKESFNVSAAAAMCLYKLSALK